MEKHTITKAIEIFGDHIYNLTKTKPAKALKQLSFAYSASDILDVIDLYETQQFVIVKAIYYDRENQNTFANIEIGCKDGTDDIVSFTPISNL